VRQGSKRDTEQREFASTQFDSGQQGQAVFGREPDNEFATAIVLAR
jgi:hypothetical protein